MHERIPGLQLATSAPKGRGLKYIIGSVAEPTPILAISAPKERGLKKLVNAAIYVA
jgi:hypothetical protein